jgi:hypothetical protein
MKRVLLVVLLLMILSAAVVTVASAAAVSGHFSQYLHPRMHDVSANSSVSFGSSMSSYWGSDSGSNFNFSHLQDGECHHGAAHASDASASY